MNETPKKIALSKKVNILCVDDCFKIEDTLKKMSAKTGHGFAYEIGFNLYLVSKALSSWRERLEKFQNEKYEKDVNGKDFVFVVNTHTGTISKGEGNKELVFDPINEPQIKGDYVSVKTLNSDESTAKRFIQAELEEIDKVLDKYKNETFEFEFKDFNEDEIKEAFKNKAFDGVDLSSLFGVLLF